MIDENATIVESETKVAACLTRQLKSNDDITWKDHLFFVYYSEDKLVIDKDHYVKPEEIMGSHISFVVTTTKENEETHEHEDDKQFTIVIEPERTAEDFYFQDTGIGITKISYHNDFGQAVGKTFGDFGKSSTAIIRGLGSLFTGGIGDAGGIIAIGFESTSILQNFGFSTFLWLWGMISVNLAIVNLLPFPGLDGWQILVTIIEGATRKEIPQKAKSIMSLIGIGLLFALMIALIIKDLFTYVF